MLFLQPLHKAVYAGAGDGEVCERGEAGAQRDAEAAAHEAGDGVDHALGDDAAAGDAEERLRVQAFGYGVQGIVHHIGRAVEGDDVGVLGLGIEIGDVRCAHRYDAVVQADEELLFPYLGDEGADGFSGRLHRFSGFHAGDGAPEVGQVDGLQEIVHRIDLEGVYGVLVIGRGHDDRGGNVGLGENVEAGAVAQLHVHENDVGGGMGAQPGQGVLDRANGAHYLHGREVGGQQMGHVLPCAELVFNNQCLHG